MQNKADGALKGKEGDTVRAPGGSQGPQDVQVVMTRTRDRLSSHDWGAVHVGGNEMTLSDRGFTTAKFKT